MNLNNWLQENGLEKYSGILEENDVDDINVLVTLSETDFESLGIPLGGRRKFLGAIAALYEQPAQQEEVWEEPQVEYEADSVEAPVPDHIPAPPPPSVSPPTPDAVAQEVTQEQVAVSPLSPVSPRSKPKSSSGSKATAIIVAVAVHVVIALLATLFVIMPPLKDDPEIVAYSVVQTEAKQEMKKKTVQKQVKRSPSSASAAAAPMAIMMRANAVAEFALPEVKTTSTGPLGVGDGELGNGGFGAGTGLGSGDGKGGMFFGTTTKGEIAVIFDITASMYEAVPEVVKEINRGFKKSQVLVMFSGGFNDKPRTKLVPYKSNSLLQKYVEVNASVNPDAVRNAKDMNKSLFKLERCDSLIPVNKNPTRQSIFNNFQSLGVGIETLLNQSKHPGTIFIFSDFRDPHSPTFMNKIAQLCVEKKVKVVFWNPLPDTPNFPAPYRTFAKKVGGEVKTKEL